MCYFILFSAPLFSSFSFLLSSILHPSTQFVQTSLPIAHPAFKQISLTTVEVYIQNQKTDMPSADIQPVVPAKRGRGRPSKMSKLLEQQAIDRANGIDTPLPELKPILPPGPKRGRGRPPGVKNGEGQKHQKNNLMNNVPPNPLAPKSTTAYPKGPGSTGTGKRGRPPGVKNGQGKNTAIKKARSSEEDGQGEIVEEDDEEDAYGIQSSSPNGQKSAKDAAAMKKGGHPYMPAYISAPMTTHSTIIPPTGAKRGRPPKK